LAFNGLRSYLREKLDGHNFITLSQLQQKASAQESPSKKNKDNFKHTRRNGNYVNRDSDNSSDESNDIYATEFCWPSKAKSYACDSLKLVHKNRQEEIKFTFDVAKCDKIFDELHKAGCIKMSHTIPPLDELKQKAYCRWYNSFSHATNDCNIFHRQVQSAINEG
jgi:peptide methionine sulfoxide reductase MsrB